MNARSDSRVLGVYYGFLINITSSRRFLLWTAYKSCTSCIEQAHAQLFVFSEIFLGFCRKETMAVFYWDQPFLVGWDG